MGCGLRNQVLALTLLTLGTYFYILGVLVVKVELEGKACWESYIDPAVKYNESIVTDSKLMSQSGINSGKQHLSGTFATSKAHLKPTFGKVVMIIIDALRADFVLSPSSHMKYLHEMISNGRAIAFTSIAKPPTVTMPRIKAITTGTIPGFMDIVFNMNSAALTEDNIIAQLKLAGKKIVFHGDDTWLKLFPGKFIRSDGTNSFFVTDYTEVDTNVTRHLETELSAKDWDVLILHYLGLDHIGHLQGPYSPTIKPKLQEMDGVIMTVQQHLEVQENAKELPALLIITGDHGMSDAGSHGGASWSEVSTPLVFISSVFKKPKELPGHVSQVDLVPTLMLLLGLPIPYNSVGRVIPELLEYMTEENKLKALQINAFQLMKLLHKGSDDIEKELGFWEYQQAVQLHNKYLLMSHGNNSQTFQHVIRSDDIANKYKKALATTTAKLTDNLSRYDEYSLVVGMVLLWIGCFLLIVPSYHFHLSSILQSPFILLVVITITFSHIWSCTGWAQDSVLCGKSPMSIFVTVLGLICTIVALKCLYMTVSHTYNLYFNNSHIKCQNDPKSKSWTLISILLLVGTLLHALSLSSSSFVEEEHQTWYFLFTSLNILIVVHLVVSLANSGCKKSGTDVFQKSGLETKQSNQGLLAKESTAMLLKKEIQEQQENTTFQSTILSEKSICHGKSLLQCLLVLVLARLLRAWIQTGNKWTHLSDISDWLNETHHTYYLTTTYVMAIIVLLCVQCICVQNRPASRCIFLILTGYFFIFLCRVRRNELHIWMLWQQEPSKGIFEARVTYACICLIIVEAAVYKTGRKFLDALISCWIMLSALLMRPSCLPAFTLLVITEFFFRRYITLHGNSTVLDVDGQTCHGQILPYLWLSHASFFWLGNSNSLSTVDVAAGYIGLAEHQGAIFLILSFAATYCGPLYCLLCMLKITELRGDETKGCLYSMHIILCCKTVVFALYTIVVYHHRYHLFIWSVFLPKLLYEISNLVIAGLFVIIIRTSLAIEFLLKRCS